MTENEICDAFRDMLYHNIDLKVTHNKVIAFYDKGYVPVMRIDFNNNIVDAGVRAIQLAVEKIKEKGE